MSHKKPKVYKESAVKLPNQSGKPIAQTGRAIDVHENTLPTWISRYSRPVENSKSARTDEH